MEIIDYFGLWEHDRSCDPQRRTLEEEREFWRCYARVYDQHAGETGGSLAQIAAVTEIVEPGSSGASARRLPVAGAVSAGGGGRILLNLF